MSDDHLWTPVPSAGDGLTLAFRQRLERAVNTVGQRLSRDEQMRALGEPDDLLVLLRTLLARGASTAPAFDEPLLQAQLRGVEAKQQLAREEGGCLPVAALQKLLRKTRQAIEKQREAGQILAVDFGSPRGWYYPQWQFEGAAPLEGLAQVLRELPRDDPWAAMIFFLRTHVAAAETPLQALRAGKRETVLRAARTFAMQGAT